MTQQGRRTMDKLTHKKEPRAMVWDEDTKRIFLSMAGETAASAAKQVLTAIGVDPAVHREQHLMLVEIIPWIQAQKKKAEAQADFWQSLVTENVRRSINGAVWLLVIAAVLGLSGAWHLLIPLITK